MSRVKVLIYAGHGGSGGYTKHLGAILAEGRVPDDVEVTLSCGPALLDAMGPLSHRVHMAVDPCCGSPSRIQRYRHHLLGFPGLRRKLQPDVVFYPSGNVRSTAGPGVDITMCQNMLPFELEICAQEPDTTLIGRMRLNRKQFARSFRVADHVVFLTEHARDRVASLVPGIKQAHVVPHGVDEADRRDEPRGYAVDGVIRGVYVSPVYAYKGQVELVRAVALARQMTGLDIRVQMIGGGNPAAVSRALSAITDCGAAGWATLSDFVPREEARQALMEADLCFFPTMVEAMSNAQLEAMAARLPLVTANSSGIPEILAGGGLSIDPRDTDAHAAAIAALCQSEALRRTMGETAYARALEFTWDRCAAATFDLFRRAAHG